MNVHILATARRPDLLPFTTLVFDTLRVGFPTAKIFVDGNGLPEFAMKPVLDAVKFAEAEFSNGLETIHHEWIEDLLNASVEPFFICDTDVVFYDSIESAPIIADAPLAGRRIPEFQDEFSGCLTRSRLHTSLLYMNPVEIKNRSKIFSDGIADTPFTPIANMVYPIVVPFKGKGVFYDTCSTLYHTVGGQAFSEPILENYFHMNFGTISDLVVPRLNGSGEAMQKARSMVLEKPILGKGAWRYQDQYYLARQR